MADNIIDPGVIDRTQKMLGTYVKKPALSEKLLKKPPFRFLHDVFRVVIRDTGYFEGLYTEYELNFENIKDRDDKMRFLQKMIDVIKIVTNNPITVRATKIVAGQEPEKTNELLQLIGFVIEKGLDWRSVVEKVTKENSDKKKDGRPPQPDKKNKEENLNRLDVNDLQKDGKSKSRSKEQIKDTKDTKDTKDAKVSKKTTSPPTKDQKPKKNYMLNGNMEKSSSKEKNEKPDKESSNKDNKSRITKTRKDTAEKSKSKSSKTRTENSDKHKRATPSPVSKDTTVTKDTTASKDTTVSRRKSSTIIESSLEEKESLSLQLKAEASHYQNAHQENERAADVLLHEAFSILPNGTSQTAEGLASEDNAQRESSEVLSARRRSSAYNIEIENNEIKQQSLNNLESLKTINGDSPSRKAVESAVKQPSNEKTSNETQQRSVSDPREVRREATFARENSRDITNSNRPRTSLRPPSARPPSARPGAPRRRDRNVEIILQPNDQVQMSGINVKLETFGNLDDDGENLVIIEDPNADNILGANDGTQEIQAEDKLEQQGHLVQQILETQKELVQQTIIGSASSSQSRTAKESGSMIGSHQSSARQVNSLRDAIQNLTKSVNPFGKLMDFIPEHIDAMQLELTMWRNSYLQTALELKRERSLTDTALEPMKIQLTQIEENTKEYVEMIDLSRAKILQNSEKIIKLLTEQ